MHAYGKIVSISTGEKGAKKHILEKRWYHTYSVGIQAVIMSDLTYIILSHDSIQFVHGLHVPQPKGA